MSEIDTLLVRAKTEPIPQRDPLTRIAVAVELVVLEMAAMRSVMFRQAKATKEMADMLADDLELDDGA